MIETWYEETREQDAPIGLDLNDGNDHPEINEPLHKLGLGPATICNFVPAVYNESWSENNIVLKSDNPTMLLSGTYDDDTTFEISAYVKQ